MPFKKGQSGNPKGRPKNSEAEELKVALAKAHTKKGLSILEHFVKRAYESDKVLVAIMKKLMADKTHIEGEVKANINVKVIDSYLPNGETNNKAKN